MRIAIARDRTRQVLLIAGIAVSVGVLGRADQQASPPPPGQAPLIWYTHPADKWENALPVGNGRLGAMVFGRTDEEQVQINEETYWSGGPYSTTVRGGYRALPQIRKLIFDGELVRAHRLFGRQLMGYPVEQQKYQSLGSLVLKLAANGTVQDYRHQLDLDTAVVTTTYTQGGVRFRRDVFVTPIDQVIVVRLAADGPGRISFTAQLRGERNDAHSNYATDYFRMDGYGPDGLVVSGKSADYLGVAGALRFQSRLRAFPSGGRMTVVDDALVVSGADEVLLLVAAATSFVNYKDVSADPVARVDAVMRAASGKAFDQLRADHVDEHRRLFRRATMRLERTANSALPTDERLQAFDGTNDPDLAALVFQFGRYLLILVFPAGHPASQPARHLEQGHESHVGFEVHDQHQYRDELLAGRGRESQRLRAAAVRDDQGTDRPGLRRRPRALRRQGLGVPPEHRHLARRRADGRPELGRVHDWRRVALDPPLGALPVHGRQGFPARLLPGHEGRGRVLPGFPGRPPDAGMAGHQPVHLARELPAGARQRPVLRRGHCGDELRDNPRRRLDDRHADPERPLRRRGRGGRRPGYRRGLPGEGARSARQARADAGREERRPPGVAQRLGAEGEEPSPHLAPLRALSRQPDSRSAGRRGWPTPRAWSSSNAGFPAMDGHRRGRRHRGHAWATARRRWTTSPTPSGTTRRAACSRSARRRCRSMARSG